MTYRISVFNEWDPLEEIIVGHATNARIPLHDRMLLPAEYGKYTNTPQSLPYSDRIIEETEEDLSQLVQTLEQLGVIVRRPAIADHACFYRTPDWESDGQYNYCPRDLFLTIDNWIIEAPMVSRARFFESFSYKSLLLNYLKMGARWISAPKPRLTDDAYNLNANASTLLNDIEPMFDAANVLRLGHDLFYLISDSGNHLGAHWLQSVLGDEYRVHTCENIYSGVHVDSTIAPIRPGLVIMNGERVGETNLPDLFKSWDVIYLHDIIDTGYIDIALSTKWVGMNLLMVKPDLAIVDKMQIPLIRELEKRQVDVIGLQLRHSRTMGGGFHCVTLDVRRSGSQEDYFE